MSNQIESRSVVVRFVESFFEERNIKWMLGIGMMILFGSSVMLVTSHWETYAPAWKHLILLAYTLAIFGASELSYWRLSLFRTGTVLQSLTVLLIPVSFLALDRIWGAVDAGPLEFGLFVILLVATCTVSWFTSRRIFRHFLRGDQTTFVLCYLILCVAGSVVPSLPQAWSPIVSFCLWIVFTVGTVKVNRHVFWLTEEHRLPRVLGFFPIALLGAQFLLLVWMTRLTVQVSLDWMGLAAVLVSVPILFAADAVTRVFQQRTGNLVRPIPWSILLPLLTGLLLCAAGICLAATSMPRPYALVPTAAVAAFMLAVVANRTERSVFVWAMLGSILLAYNFSPLYFLDFARMVVLRGAVAVNEQRLPYAFYGLTYLPLLAVATLVSSQCARRNNDLFARPVRRLSIGLALLLLSVSFTHPKAIFPVAIVLMPLFAVQTVVFRDRRLIYAAVISFVSAAFGFTFFAENVLQLSVPHDMSFLCMSVAAFALLFPGRWIDGWAASARLRWSATEMGTSPRPLVADICQTASLCVTVGTAAVWSFSFAPFWSKSVPCTACVLLGLLLVVHTFKWLMPCLGEMTISFIGGSALLQMLSRDFQFSTILSTFNICVLVCWVGSLALQYRPTYRMSLAFGAPLRNASVVCLTCIMLIQLLLLGTTSIEIHDLLSWTCALLTIAWTFDAARRLSAQSFTILGCLGAMAFESGLVGKLYGAEFLREWLPTVWATTALLAMPLSARMQVRWKTAADSTSELVNMSGYRAVAIPLNGFVLATAVIIASSSLVYLSVPMRVAGGIAAISLLASGALRRSQALMFFGLILANLQLLCLVIGVFAPDVTTILELNLQTGLLACLPVAACAGLSLLVNDVADLRRGTTDGNCAAEATADTFWVERLFELNSSFLRALIGASLFASLQLAQFRLSSFQIVAALTAFGSFAACEFLVACRRDDAKRVWIGQLLIAVAIGYFVWMGVIVLGSSASMFAALAVAFVAWTVGRISLHVATTRVLSEPLTTTGLALPLLTVGLAVFRHLQFASADWLGMNSLAVLLVAAFYFWIGVERRQNAWFVLAAGILNVALALLWRELSWHDPQFFMVPLGISILVIVQLLRREIPETMHSPLPYLGALMILVSPTFHIVSGSWTHLLTLMVLAVGVTLVSIGLRVRALMYTGTAFLVADLVAMICRGGIDYPHLLWIGGILLGAAVVSLAAYCERHRERLLQRLRLLAAGLETWQ